MSRNLKTLPCSVCGEAVWNDYGEKTVTCLECATKPNYFAIETEWTLNGAGIHSVTIVLPGGTDKRMSPARFREWLEEESRRQQTAD